MADYSMDGNKVWSEGFGLTRNKSLEFQMGRFREGNVFEAALIWTRRQDHAGVGLRLEIFGVHLIVNLHDNRHWNWKKGRWYDEDEEQAERDSCKEQKAG